jgi:hypothetical protein
LPPRCLTAAVTTCPPLTFHNHNQRNHGGRRGRR